MNRIERLRLTLEALENVISEPLTGDQTERACTLTECLIQEVRGLLKDETPKDAESDTFADAA